MLMAVTYARAHNCTMRTATSSARRATQVIAAAVVGVLATGCSGAASAERPDIGHGRFGVTVIAPVTRYPVTATSLGEIQSEIRQNGPRIDGKQWAGVTRYSMRWNYMARPNPLTGCELRDIRIELTAAITMPEWRPEEEADDATKFWWRRFERGLMDHEAGHARLAVDSANRLRDALARLRAGDCNALHREAGAIAQQHHERLRIAQERYDAETRHGGTQITASLRADAP
jgi:predicted secreted Zn-dependent protease